MARVTMAVLLATVVGCAGSSGPRGVAPVDEAPSGSAAEAAEAGPGEPPVDESRRVAELDPEENARLCEWLARIAGEPRTIECGEGHTVRLGESRCPPAESWAGCSLTVGESAACLRSILADPCAAGFFQTPECESMGACVRAQLEAAAEGVPGPGAEGGGEAPAAPDPAAAP